MIDSSQAQGSTFKAKVDVVEWLGNEAYAYIPFEAPARGAGAAAPARARPRRRVAAHPAGDLASTAPAGSREGDEAEIYVDSSQMHLFDPATGENLTLDASSGRHGAERHVDAEAVAEQQDAVATPAEQEGAS